MPRISENVANVQHSERMEVLMKFVSVKNVFDSGKKQAKSYEETRKEKSEERAKKALNALLGKK